ncbi:MAG TPA: 1-(5-phosphoribosyl)-5-[(5-phosphoribosylamino)methylideneamino] imidazole-4-carboxamide isomerase [Actinomycetota bacterium]|nr:1-(5-phosphoribosyl)-5-[(5-phosphoribosylamino)methylideneamino] imidazole-4-carboxamide isomerase [Actinomycetota bacterium]
MIVFPAIDVLGGRCVRLVRGDPTNRKVYGDPVRIAERLAGEGATWLHVVDLDAAFGRGSNEQAIRRVIAAAEISVQVAGGIRSTDALRGWLDAGAERVVLGTSAALDQDMLWDLTAAREFDSVVVALDVSGGEVRVKGWTESAGPLAKVAPRMVQAGVQRFQVTAIDRDGTMEGPDLHLFTQVMDLTGVPVIAAGGVATVQDVRDLAKTGVEGVIVGRALLDGVFTLAQALDAAS